MNQEKIYDIEKRIAELKFLERDLIKERDVGRIRSLDIAEKSVIVEDVIKKFFITSGEAKRKELVVNSFPSGFSGRDNEEFMSEVRVEIRFKPGEEIKGYSDLALYLYLKHGFQDEEVQKLEERIMDRLYEIRKDVDILKESKKSLKYNK